MKEKFPLKIGQVVFSVYSAVVLVAFFLCTSCYHFPGNANPGDVPLTSNVHKIIVLDSSFSHFENLNHASVVHSFYLERHFVAAWWKNRKPIPQADTLVKMISTIRRYGLLPQHYHWNELSSIFSDTTSADETKFQRADMLLTDAFISIIGNLKSGRDGLHKDSTLLHKNDSLAIIALNAVLITNEARKILEQQEPRHVQYNLLKRELRNLLDECDVATRQKLMAGEKIDTLAPSNKLITLEINMDRWRNEPPLPDRYIIVNIPGGYLHVVQADTLSLSSKVIVGTAKNETPVLNGMIRSFMIYPYWNVPRGIAVNEILPQVKKDSLYLRNHRYEVLDRYGDVISPESIDWNSLHSNNFPYTFRQKEGTHNALGLIKFWFNNPYSVYLHDTNARLLFNRKKRALSHGCVRVEKAMELGRLLVEGNDLCTPEDLDQYLQMQKQMGIKVTEPIPVLIRYYTCWVHSDGAEFYDDVYEYDKKKMERYAHESDEPIVM